MMKRYFSFLAIVLALLLSGTGGCTSDKAKKPPESDRADEILLVVRSAFETYDAGRFEEFAALWKPEAAGGLSRFPGVARHTFTTRMIELDATETRVVVSWTCRWEREGQTSTGSGTAAFILAGSPLRIVAVESDSPFVPPSQPD